MIRVRYLGMMPQDGYREYGFQIKDPGDSHREIILTIDNVLFLENGLKIQEAPDLCYQKIKYDLENEETSGPINSPLAVTLSDVAHYRDSHPDPRARSKR